MRNMKQEISDKGVVVKPAYHGSSSMMCEIGPSSDLAGIFCPGGTLQRLKLLTFKGKKLVLSEIVILVHRTIFLSYGSSQYSPLIRNSESQILSHYFYNDY